MGNHAIDPHDQRVSREVLGRMRHTRTLSAEALDLIARNSHSKVVAAGEPIWQRGTPGDFFALIDDGFVEINRHSTNENETTVGLFGPSDAIGMIAALRSGNYPGTARALTPKTRILRCYLKPNTHQPMGEEIQTWIREMILKHEQVLRDKIDILNGQTSEIRLLELLLQLTRRFGKKDAAGQCQVPLYLTRSQISRFVNIRVETVIRILSRWSKAGWVTWTKEGLLVTNIHALKSDLYRKSL